MSGVKFAFSALLCLGLSVFPFMAGASDATLTETTAPSSQEARDAELSELRELRAEKADARQDEIAYQRKQEKDKRADRRLRNDVQMILNRSIQQSAELDAQATERAKEAVLYEGVCYTGAKGERVCVKGVYDELTSQKRAAEIKILRDDYNSKYSGTCKINKDGERVCTRASVDKKITDDLQAYRDEVRASAPREGTAAQVEAQSDAAFVNLLRGKPDTIGKSINRFMLNLTRFPLLFYIMAYTCGVYFMAMGLIKANRSVLDPSRNPISDAVKQMGAGVFLAALPLTVDTLQRSFGFANSANLVFNFKNPDASGAAETLSSASTAEGLDQFLFNLVSDITQPMLVIVGFIAFAGGVWLIVQGLQRLTKGAQEGPKGPAGIGTLMHFAMGAALVSFGPTLHIVMNSVFGSSKLLTYPDMGTIAGKIGEEASNMAQAEMTFAALLAFLAIIGVISFARGLFMMKDVADGAQNASLMGSMSHIIAGVCCVNFGAFANALQNTLKLTGYGITFQ